MLCGKCSLYVLVWVFQKNVRKLFFCHATCSKIVFVIIVQLLQLAKPKRIFRRKKRVKRFIILWKKGNKQTTVLRLISYRRHCCCCCCCCHFIWIRKNEWVIRACSKLRKAFTALPIHESPKANSRSEVNFCVCVCVCVKRDRECVSEWKSERKRDRVSEKESEWLRERERLTYSLHFSALWRVVKAYSHTNGTLLLNSRKKH